MKAKDRIIKTNEENCYNTLEERLAEQDRISFKAGEQQGMRRVVDFVESDIFPKLNMSSVSIIFKDKWNTRLKEWEETKERR